MLYNKSDEEIKDMLGFPTGLDESFADSVKTIIKKLQSASSKDQLLGVYKELGKLIK